jgi:hypothetical protein
MQSIRLAEELSYCVSGAEIFGAVDGKLLDSYR